MAQPDMWLSLKVGSELYDYQHESVSVKCMKLLQRRSYATQQLTIEVRLPTTPLACASCTGCVGNMLTQVLVPCSRFQAWFLEALSQMT